MKHKIIKWVSAILSLALLTSCGLLRGIQQFDGKNGTPALAGHPLPPSPALIKTGAQTPLTKPRALATLASAPQGEPVASMETWAGSLAGMGKVCRVLPDGGLEIDQQVLAHFDMLNIMATNRPVVLVLTNENDIIGTNLWIMTSNQAQAFKALDTKLRRERNPALVSQ